MRPSDGYQGIDEILQADVMRFMAIIAFCLIAILTLVRTVEPAVPAAPSARPVPEPEPLLTLRPNVAVEQQPAAPATAEPLPPDPAAARLEVSAEALAEAPAAATEPPVDDTPAAVPPAADAADQPEPGLTLRFASERDFLRLLSRGEIRVFAFRPGEVLAVGQDLEFQPAPAPAQLHELMPQTIPKLMTSALGGARSDTEYRWGVTLPERVARAIRSHLQSGANGELVIDRFGEVRLHDA